MNHIKSHFTFTKKQRNGILWLLIVVFFSQGAYYFFDFPSENIKVDTQKLADFQREIDSLKAVKVIENKPKIYPFNPNFITDYKGYTLGMTPVEIDRLHHFRKQDKWVNSIKDFQKVTQVSDSLLAEISPFFKFPEWVTNPKKQYTASFKTNQPKSEAQKIDLNIATSAQLQKVYGIGEYYANSIINYRTKHNGFASLVELNGIYGLKPETIEELKKSFSLKTPKAITKINLNTASRDQLVTIEFIDYEIAHNIIEYRTLHEGFDSFEDLVKVIDFPLKKLEIIKLYLRLN